MRGTYRKINGYTGYQMFKVVEKVKVNSDSLSGVTLCVTSDPDVMRITREATSELKATMPTQSIMVTALPINVTVINNQVVECDLQIMYKATTKRNTWNNEKAKLSRNNKRVSNFKTFKVIFEDEDGDRSEEVFKDFTKDQLLEKLEYNFTKFGLKTISVNGKKCLDITDTKKGVAYYV